MPLTRPNVVLGIVGLSVALCAESVGAAELSLAWDPVIDPSLSGYKIYYDTDGPGAPYTGQGATEGASPVKVPLASFVDAAAPEARLHGLESCQRYWIAVTAYSDIDGGASESTFSNQVEKTAVASPSPVTVTPLSSTSVRVDWAGLPAGDVGNIPKYRVHYATHPGTPYDGAGSPVEIATSSLSNPLQPSTVLSGLPAGATLYVAVEAVCPDGTTKMSDETSSAATADGGSASDGGASASEGGAQVDGSPAPPVGGPAQGSSTTPATDPSQDGAAATEDAAGCACRLGGPSRRPVGAWSGVLVAVAAFLARRRRS